MTDLRYPIGDFVHQENYSSQEIAGFLEELKSFPLKLRAVTKDISEQQLETPYREGGWTARQVIHHLADSHMNMLVRLKWTQTEETPDIKAYHEDRWAEEADYKLPIEVSIEMLKSIHARALALLESYSEEELAKKYYHPQSKMYWNIKMVMANYAWHGNHHIAHLKICKGEW
ncbi:YfiT family bacillithiol transferase [Jiulongibacter sp. NS-SX5]|uniref:YfiT family bacillithiol transferase n=1 Tax=Jiulongibacter sp. NS-SX5 TaxID=3463854 RepID=UPI004057D934